MPLPDLTDEAKMARAGRRATLRYAHSSAALELRALCMELCNRREDAPAFQKLEKIKKLADEIVEIEAALRNI